MFLFFDYVGEDTKLKMNRTKKKCKKFLVNMQKKILRIARKKIS